MDVIFANLLNVLKILGIIVLIAGGLYVGLRIFLMVKRNSDISKVLKSPKRTGNFIYNLLLTTYSAKNILPNAQFLSSGNMTRIDIIAVLKGGVYIININHMRGFIENPVKGSWQQRFNNQIILFQNPFERNMVNVNTVKNILNHERIINVPIYNVTVFTDPKISFKYKEEMLLTAETLLNFIHDTNMKKFLKSSEISNILRTLKKHKNTVRPMTNKTNNNLPPQNSTTLL
jgi:hypothetical protein